MIPTDGPDGAARPAPSAGAPQAKRAPSAARRLAVIALALAVLAATLLAPLPETAPTGAILGFEGRRALAGLAFALILWIGEALPFHITGLVAMAALALLRVASWPELVMNGFGDESTVFFIGVLVIAAALARTGLASRLGGAVLRLTGASTRAIVFGFLAAGAALAMWITALAAAALMLPLARSLLEDEGERPGESRFGRALMMAVAWGPLIGALAAPSGSGSNPVALRFLAEIGGFELGFLDWMAFGVPTAALLLPVAWLVLMALSPPERPSLRADAARATAADGRGLGERKALGRDEKAVAVVFLTVIACWLAAPSWASILGFKPSIGMVAALGASALFLPGVTSLRWKDLEKSMDWAGVLLIATGVSLGTALYRSGAAAWVAGIAFGGIGSLAPFWRLVAVVAGVLAVKVVFSSNTLTGTIIVPLVLALGPALGLDMRLAALAAGFTANLAVLLVTTSPVNVLPWTTGYFSIKDMAIAGIVFAPAAALIIAAVLSLIGALYGLG